MNVVTSNNFFINALMFPGLFHTSSYSVDSYRRGRDEALELANEQRGKQAAAEKGNEKEKAKEKQEAGKVVVRPAPALRLLFIPFKFKHMSFADCFNEGGQYIPALLSVADSAKTGGGGSIFVIHFHGNACDNGQVGVCALREGYSLNAHYLLVEYPRYGFARGFPSESLLNAIAQSVYDFVVHELRVPSDRIVLIGRSVGCGPVCHLASQLQLRSTPPSAIILQSPYTSIRDTANDLIGCVSWFMFDRWANWKVLAYTGEGRRRLLAAKPSLPISSAPSSSSSSSSKSQQHKQAKTQPPSPSSSSSSSLFFPPLWDCMCFRPPAVIECPVLFIHADQDQIIDYHHSVTMHSLRTRDDLPSELYTQVSTPIFLKDHNHYDYDHDVIIPSRDFLARNIDYSSAAHVLLPADVIAAVCTVPPEYQGAQYRERPRPSPAALAVAVAGVAAAASSSSSSTPASKSTPASPVHTPPSKWTACLAIRCLVCCPLCFCTECTLAIAAKGLRECCYAVSGQQPAFQYATRAARRKSGGIPTEPESGGSAGDTEATWRTVEGSSSVQALTVTTVVSKLLRKGEPAQVTVNEAVQNPLQEDQQDQSLPAAAREPKDIIPDAPRRLLVNADSAEAHAKLDYVPG